MTICFFGYPNRNYSRSKILIDGLQKNNVKVIHCEDKSSSSLVRYFRLAQKFWRLRDKCDVIFVQFPGHLNVPIAWILGKLFNKLVVFDAFISLYDTYVFDREAFSANSLKGKFYWWVDKISCTLADLVIIDTNTHVKYFVATFKLDKNKFHAIPVGGDNTVFKPKSKIPSASLRAGKNLKSLRPRSGQAKIIIEFHGMFTKIHGAECFVRVAKKLEHQTNLEFWLIGSSTNYHLPIDLYKKLKPKTMKYWPQLSVDKLAKKIAQADIGIAHLGPTQKARMVLTNKMYHVLASRVALIAGNNPASKEFLKEKQNCLMVKMYDDNDLAKKILQLAKNKKLRRKVAQNGYKLHQEKFTNRKLGQKLKQILETKTF